MTYQPMFGTVSDNQGYIRQTSSRRGRVTSVNCWINSEFGTVLNASASYKDCPLPDLRRIPKERRQKVIDSCRKEERVAININIEPNPHYILRINGLNIPMKKLQRLQEWDMQKFNLQIKRVEQMMKNGQAANAMKIAQQIMER
jgi:hypothetical protein